MCSSDLHDYQQLQGDPIVQDLGADSLLGRRPRVDSSEDEGEVCQSVPGPGVWKNIMLALLCPTQLVPGLLDKSVGLQILMLCYRDSHPFSGQPHLHHIVPVGCTYDSTRSAQ